MCIMSRERTEGGRFPIEIGIGIGIAIEIEIRWASQKNFLFLLYCKYLM